MKILSMRFRRSVLFLAVVLFLGSGYSAAGKVAFEHSIVPVENAAVERREAGIVRTYGRVVRPALTQQELGVSMSFSLSLKLNHADELNARIAKGEVLSAAELERYLPSSEDYAKVRAWLLASGFKITLDSSARHAVFAEGSAS